MSYQAYIECKTLFRQSNKVYNKFQWCVGVSNITHEEHIIKKYQNECKEDIQNYNAKHKII